MATPMDPEFPLLKQYAGNCHCGAFRFSINITTLRKVRACNCSICIRNGYLWVFPVADEALLIEKGETTLKEYEFGEKTMAHLFCPICGTSVMGRRKNASKEMTIAINARTFRDIDLGTLEVESFKGADLEPPYKSPKPPKEPKETESGLIIYDGNCHCGAVTYTVNTKPLTEIEITSCNCSLCSRNGDLWIYPKKAAVDLRGAEALTDYAFLHEDSLHSFCGRCGVSVIVRVLGSGEGDDICPVNVRTINGIQLDDLKLKKYEGWKNDPQYFLRN